MDWSKEDYREMAIRVAGLLNQDVEASVLVDTENFITYLSVL